MSFLKAKYEMVKVKLICLKCGYSEIINSINYKIYGDYWKLRCPNCQNKKVLLVEVEE